jgi:hypothetical protein
MKNRIIICWEKCKIWKEKPKDYNNKSYKDKNNRMYNKSTNS